MAKHDPAIMEPICCKLLLHQEEGWKTSPGTRLPTAQQIDKEKLKPITSHPIGSRQISRMLFVHQIQYSLGVQQYPNQTRRQIESGIPHT